MRRLSEGPATRGLPSRLQTTRVTAWTHSTAADEDGAAAMIFFSRARGRTSEIPSDLEPGMAGQEPGSGLASLQGSDAAQIQRAREGDPDVWREWYAAYYRSLYRYAYIRLRQRDEAEDIAAQVFLEAVRGIDRYRGAGAVLAWLYGIEKNLIFDRLKARSREPEEAEAPAPEDVDDSLEALTNNIDLQRALEALTEEQRDAIILRYFVGLSTREIASMLRKTPTAVFSVEARALAALRRRLGEGFLR